MPNLISFQLPVTHTSIYHTIKIMTVLPIQYKDQGVQVNPILLDIKQEFEMPNPCKFFKSPEHNEEIVPTSNCGEKSLFNTPVKATLKDKPNINDDSITEPESKDEQIKTALANAQGDGLLTFHNSSLHSCSSSLSQDSISTFVLMRSPSPPESTHRAKHLKCEKD
ncbi:hypothetical protein V8B97DRAFT_1917163 [Scleroderma yunnanense]